VSKEAYYIRKRDLLPTRRTVVLTGMQWLLLSVHVAVCGIVKRGLIHREKRPSAYSEDCGVDRDAVAVVVGPRGEVDIGCHR